MTHLPSFLDFEASSLRDSSYPIEVAWSLPDGTIEAHLISPASVPAWTDWSREAESIHGISRAELIERGQPPVWVAGRLNDCLAGQSLYTDAPDYDGMWLAELFSQTPLTPQFTLQSVELKLLMSLLAGLVSDRTAAYKLVNKLKPKARQRCGGRQHRAAADVRFLIELWRLAVAHTHSPGAPITS